MVLWSTRKSISAEDISLLAMCELVVATGIFAIVYYNAGFSTPILIAIFLAPLTLLRTPSSELHSHELARKVLSWLMSQWSSGAEYIDRRTKRFRGQRILTTEEIATFPLRYKIMLPLYLVVSSCIMIPIMLLTTLVVACIFSFFIAIALAIRIYTTAVAILIHPIDTLSSIPNNWRRLLLCIDSATPPELLSGLNNIRPYGKYNVLSVLRSGVVARTFRKSIKKVAKKYSHFPLATALPRALSYVHLIFVFLVLFIPALSLRWSIKCSALLWSPLLWIFRPIRWSSKPAHLANAIVNLDLYKFSRVYSLLIILLYAAKMFIWLKAAELLSLTYSLVDNSTFDALVVPSKILTWHAVAFANAILTWIIFFQSERYLHDLNGNFDVSENAMRTFYITAIWFRNFMAIYILLCISYITIGMFLSLNMRPPTLIFVPW